MNCGHLFNGIGGFALAAHWMGWSNLMHCEVDPFCNKVMNYHFPNSYQHEDIRTTDFTIWRGKLDLITGGFPCQPYSTAGKRKGKEDDRHLWPEMLRAIREISPNYVVGENVRGLTNWNGGLVFDEVQADLEAEGYEVLPFLLPAAGVGAPHRRDRIWFVANAGRVSCDRRESNRSKQSFNNGQDDRREEKTDKSERLYKERADSDAGGKRLEDWSVAKVNAKEGWQNEGRQSGEYACDNWSEWPTQPPVCNRNDGLSGELADITFSKWRKESIKALGNAIVPGVAFQIFKAIEEYETQTS